MMAHTFDIMNRKNVSQSFNLANEYSFDAVQHRTDVSLSRDQTLPLLNGKTFGTWIEVHPVQRPSTRRR